MSRKDNNFKSDDDSSETNKDSTESSEDSESNGRSESSESSSQESDTPRYEFKPVETEDDTHTAKKSGKSGKRSNFVMFAGVFIVGIIIGALAISSMLPSPVTGAAVADGVDIGPEAAAAKAVDYIAVRLEQSYPGIEIVSDGVAESTDIPGTYEVSITMTYQDMPQTAPYYVSKDGNWMFGGLIDLNEEFQSPDTPSTPATTELQKSDTPKAELFIWSYCPYGVQAQGPLSEVALLLEDYAHFDAVLYYDGHGAYETQQNKIQACIQEVAPESYWDYASGFVETIYPKCGASRDVECDKAESVNLMKSLGIDDAAVMTCVDEQGDDLLADHTARASDYGVTGSPTLIINGARVNAARNSEAFKAAICDAFNAPPEECGETLSMESAAASGSC